MFEVLAPPLTGIRVLDLSAIVAGPTASMILADLGADVIKVERPGGEDGRAMGPHRGPWGAYFVTLNRGKRSVCLDITKPAGRDAVLRLAQGCDVFLENFRGGKAAALGLDEEAVRARRADIIYASLTGYGPRGPDSTRAGYDAVLQARTGIMSVTGEIGASSPIRTGVSVLDMGSGVWTALGILAAVVERQRSGKGQRVDSSLFQTGIMYMAYHLMYRQFAGVNPQPQGSGHTAFAPYGAFATADGAIMLGISSDRLFRSLCTALEKPEWAVDVRFRTNPDRVQHRPELDGLIQELVRAQPSAHWVELLTRYDVACDAIQDVGEVMADAQLAALGQLAEVELAGQSASSVPRLPIELSLSQPVVSGPPPAAGEHTRAVLKEAGYNDAEIDDLIRCGVCAAGT